MSYLIKPAGYKALLNLPQTEMGIKKIKDFFQQNLSSELRLRRVTAPLFVLKGMGIMQTNASARALVRQLRVRGMVPTDLLEADGKTYVQQFAKALAEKEIVVFDTETTGLDVYNDDRLQHAKCEREGWWKVLSSRYISLQISLYQRCLAI